MSSTENSLNGKIDIALFQSCMSDNEVRPFVRDYGMVIVDECHHAPASNFERVMKEVNARYVYGLTATIAISTQTKAFMHRLLKD